jgi:hypothetical protein
MAMQRLTLLIFLCLLTSCDLFVSKDKKTQELVNKELLEIDWNDVDAYPIFEDCDETQTKTEQRECFENGLLKYFSEALTEFEFVLQPDIDPKVIVDFLVDKEGRITIIEIKKDSTISKQMPEFDGIISQSLKRIPPLAPAIKNRIPVKAKFRIPIILKSE